MKISVVGLGKIGSCILATLASEFEVIGIDLNRNIVDKINKGIAPHYEPQLGELLKDNKKRITATTDIRKIAETELTIIMVQTPSLEDGSFSTKYIETAIAEIARYIPDRYHTVVVTSTVLPGTMDEKIKPLLERISGKKLGEKIGLCYVPEFIALGSIIENLSNPDFVVIGESDKKAGKTVAQVYEKFFQSMCSDAPIYRMSFYNSELVKIALNVYITMKISFANTISEICENMPTGDAEKVLKAIGTDSRIGQKFFRPGLSYGGTCFPRDNKAFNHIAEKYKSQGLLSKTAELVNIKQIDRIVSLIKYVLSDIGTNKLSVLGITYKPDTNLTIESASLKIVQKLSEEGIDISVYDPAVKHGYDDLPMVSGVAWSNSIEQCLKNSEVVFIATPWNEFKNIKRDIFLKFLKGKKTIIDAWGIQNKLKYDAELKYYQIGVYSG